MSNKNGLNPKRIVNRAGVETTVHVRDNQGVVPESSPLRGMPAPEPMSRDTNGHVIWSADHPRFDRFNTSEARVHALRMEALIYDEGSEVREDPTFNDEVKARAQSISNRSDFSKFMEEFYEAPEGSGDMIPSYEEVHDPDARSSDGRLLSEYSDYS